MHALALGLACFAAACSDRPTAPRAVNPSAPSTSLGQGAAGAAAARAALLTNIPVSGTLASGGSFSGTLTATKLTVDETTRQLTLTGVLNGTAMKATGEVVDIVNQTFTAPVTLSRPGTSSALIQPAAQASCSILNLVLGPLHLDLLGLVVDLNQVVLNITGATGAGNLLGNLLCALTGLLDIPGAIASISHILQSINNILSGLTVPGVGGVMWIAPRQPTQMWSA
jgi:hypothetical protein